MEPNKKKRVKAMLPLFALPFAAILFYVAGGGQSSRAIPDNNSGLNTILPSPAGEEETLDKLSLYRKLERDSAEALRQYDPFNLFPAVDNDSAGRVPAGAIESPFGEDRLFRSGATQGRQSEPDIQIANMERKLAELQSVIDAPQVTRSLPSSSPDIPRSDDMEFAQLENMMKSIREEPTQDKELLQMNGMLEKILDIQHPQRVIDRVKEASSLQADKAFPIEHLNQNVAPDYFGAIKADSASAGKQRFFDNTAVDTTRANANAAISAAVHDEQTLVSGAFVKIRIRQPFYVAGVLIPTGAFVFGNCSLAGERLNISVSSVRAGNLVLPVNLSVYDLDGNAGIRIPGSISRDASKQGADQAIQQVALASLDPSLAAQATTAAVETAKSLISKKVRLIKVTVKSDYPVLLKSAQ
jgi:conjugative transposon TraM protein